MCGSIRFWSAACPMVRVAPVVVCTSTPLNGRANGYGSPIMFQPSWSGILNDDLVNDWPNVKTGIAAGASTKKPRPTGRVSTTVPELSVIGVTGAGSVSSGWNVAFTFGLGSVAENFAYGPTVSPLCEPSEAGSR